MGNEMSNNTNPGLKEDEKTNIQDHEKSSQEPIHANAEGKEQHQNGTGLVSNVTNEAEHGYAHNLNSDKTEKEENEVQMLVESLKADKKFNEEGGKENKLHFEASSPSKLEDHLNSKEGVSKMSSNQIEKQSSFKTEEQDTPPSAELEHIQHELTKTRVNRSGENSERSVEESESFPGSGIAGNGKENGHLLDACLVDNLEGSVILCTNLDMEGKGDELLEKNMLCEEDEMLSREKFEVEPEVVINSENDLREERLESLDYIETESIGKESESADSKHDDCVPVRILNVDNDNVSDTYSLTKPDCKNTEKEVSLLTASVANGQVKEVRVFAESDNNKEYSEECCEGSERKFLLVQELGVSKVKSSTDNGRYESGQLDDSKPEAIVAYDAVNSGNCQVQEAMTVEQSDSQNESCEEEPGGSELVANVKLEEKSGNPKSEAYTDCAAVSNENYKAEKAKVVEVSDNQDHASEGKITMIPELGILPVAFPTANCKSCGEESENLKAMECEPDENQMMEIKENLEERNLSARPPLPAEAHQPCSPASEFQSDEHEQETVMKSQNAQDSSESTFDLKPEPESSISFITEAAVVSHPTSSHVETLITQAELTSGELADGGFVTEAASESVAETKSSASVYNSSQQQQEIDSFMLAREVTQAQENAGRLNTEQIPERKTEAELTKTLSLATESRDIAVLLETENPQEVPHCNRPQVAIEVDPSASANEAQESTGRLESNSIPDYLNVYAEMRRSPSFDIDIRKGTEESERTPLLLHQDKNTSASRNKYSQQSLDCHEMPVEEKVITLERSDSDKSKMPFLGFFKEDNEVAHILAIPTKQEKQAAANKTINNENAAMPMEIKEKQKRRLSIFSNCMCCTTAIN